MSVETFTDDIRRQLTDDQAVFARLRELGLLIGERPWRAGVKPADSIPIDDWVDAARRAGRLAVVDPAVFPKGCPFAAARHYVMIAQLWGTAERNRWRRERARADAFTAHQRRAATLAAALRKFADAEELVRRSFAYAPFPASGGILEPSLEVAAIEAAANALGRLGSRNATDVRRARVNNAPDVFGRAFVATLGYGFRWLTDREPGNTVDFAEFVDAAWVSVEGGERDFASAIRRAVREHRGRWLAYDHPAGYRTFPIAPIAPGSHFSKK